MIKVFIDPRTRISYASYYIYGLYKIYGKKNVGFSMKYFKDLIQKNGLDDFDQYFAFVTIENNIIIKRIVIDYRDKNSINYVALDWCDSYGKVNFNSNTEEFEKLSDPLKTRILAIGPNFGIKIWNSLETIQMLIVNFIKAKSYLPIGFRSFLAGYNWQIKRMPYSHYLVSETTQNYVFFISSLYYDNDEYRSNTNKNRAAYVKACKNIEKLHFEGGLLAANNHPNKKLYKDILTPNYIQPEDYLKKIRKSAIVFNTPAIWGCHGWKLGEFLAMGKAMISMPLLNDMPFPFEHGKHVHFVNSYKEIDFAVHKILNDNSYRKQLEVGAMYYFENYLTPEKVIKRLTD